VWGMDEDVEIEVKDRVYRRAVVWMEEMRG
jgi:hypothetical protein